MFELKYIICGIFVGFMTGLTGIGGGSLMAPILISFMGVAPTTAIGTDLFFAFFTKLPSVALLSHKKFVKWKIVFWLMLGSIPATLVVIALETWLHVARSNNRVITFGMGIIIIVSAVFYLAISTLKTLHKDNNPVIIKSRAKKGMTVVLGGVIGTMVTLTSIGAGTLGTSVLMLYYPRLPVINLIATELAHIMPVIFLAALAYAFWGVVDTKLLLNLIIGSIPASYIGSTLASKMPQKLLTVLVVALLIILASRMLYSVCC